MAGLGPAPLAAWAVAAWAGAIRLAGTSSPAAARATATATTRILDRWMPGMMFMRSSFLVAFHCYEQLPPGTSVVASAKSLAAPRVPAALVSLGLGADLGGRPFDLLQRLALGVDPEEDLDQPADDHDAAADQVADGQAGAVGAVADQRAVEDRAERAEDLGDGEEHRDGLGPDLDREDLADRQIAGARPSGGEEEHDDPAVPGWYCGPAAGVSLRQQSSKTHPS